MMHQSDQDVIDDFLLAVASRGLSLRGQFLAHVMQRALDGTNEPGEQELTRLGPGKLLQMAKAWKNDPDVGIKGLG